MNSLERSNKLGTLPLSRGCRQGVRRLVAGFKGELHFAFRSAELLPVRPNKFAVKGGDQSQHSMSELVENKIEHRANKLVLTCSRGLHRARHRAITRE